MLKETGSDHVEGEPEAAPGQAGAHQGRWKGIKLLLRRPEWSEDDLEREIARHNAAGEFVVVWECPPYLSEWPPEMLERYG